MPIERSRYRNFPAALAGAEPHICAANANAATPISSFVVDNIPILPVTVMCYFEWLSLLVSLTGKKRFYNKNSSDSLARRQAKFVFSDNRFVHRNSAKSEGRRKLCGEYTPMVGRSERLNDVVVALREDAERERHRRGAGTRQIEG